MMMEMCGATSLMMTEIYSAIMELHGATSRMTEVSYYQYDGGVCYHLYDGGVVIPVI